MRALESAAVTRLRELIRASAPYSAICAEIGCTKSTVSYHAAKLGLSTAKRKHDWLAIRAFYDAGNSARATRREFALDAKTWQEAIKRGDILARPGRLWVRSIGDVMSAPIVNRTSLKRRMIREGVIIEQCALCEISTWRGQPLSLELDHINGNPRDYRLEKLRLLCPNCHSQTETFSRRKSARSVPVPVPSAPASAPYGSAEEQPAQ